MISVEDTGVGISSEELQDVLQKFGRASDSYVRAQEGLGLGLTIVQLLAETNGWDFQLESEVGVGTTVEITFPRKSLFSKRRTHAIAPKVCR
jgi:signal transduction histidine kinase